MGITKVPPRLSLKNYPRKTNESEVACFRNAFSNELKWEGLSFLCPVKMTFNQSEFQWPKFWVKDWLCLMFYGLLGVRLAYRQGVERWDILYFIPPKGMQSQSSMALDLRSSWNTPFCQAVHSKTQEQVRMEVSIGHLLLLPSPAFGGPTAPTPLEAPSLTHLLCNDPWAIPQIAPLLFRNCGRDSRITE